MSLCVTTRRTGCATEWTEFGMHLLCAVQNLFFALQFMRSRTIRIDGINAIAWKLNNVRSQPCLFCVYHIHHRRFGLTQRHRHATQAKISMAICEATTAEPKTLGGAAIVAGT